MKNKQLFTVCLLAACSVISATGCTSIRSTFLGKDVQGKYSGDCEETRACGVPIKLKVPTHVEVSINEVYYIDTASGDVIYPERRILFVSEPEKIYEYQLFTVDIARPFSGTLDMTGANAGYALDENQQLTSLGATTTDNTLSSISKILTEDKGLFGNKTSTGSGGDGLSRQTRVIATKRFDINEFNWHETMNQWVENFMHDCSESCSIGCQCAQCVSQVGAMEDSTPATSEFSDVAEASLGVKESSPAYFK